ncbi:reticulon-3 isoform X2 [Daphnia magna]|uniref:Reticulon-like protein n=1 Tax=Daphnia magna TaxID=35525 RepID=A0A0P5V1Z0_9CRUS|nr:reticulon-3 isoform X2 [Daphnia magna]KZS15444.1 Reticulon-like protein [Daphnia magna]
MDQYETSNPSGKFPTENEQSLHEEDVKNKSHTREETNPDSDRDDHEAHIPSRLDQDEQSGAQNGNIPREDFSLKQDEILPEDKEDDFDFEKKLPEIPSENQKNDSDSSMKFSPAHFQDKAIHEAEQLHPDVKQEEYSHEDVEEEEVVEPEQEVSHRKPQEASPEAVPHKQEEISTPSQSQSSSSEAPIEEPKQEKISNKSLESVPTEENLVSTSPTSQPESKSHHPEPASFAERDSSAEPTPTAAEPLKTRSVKSMKSEGRSFLVVDLVHWRDPRKSGIVLGAILAILLSLSVVSVVSVISYSALAVLSGTLSFRLYKNVLQAVQKTQDGHPFKEYLEQDVTVTTEKVHEVADLTAAKLNATLVELRRLFLVEDLVDSVKFALVLWALTYVGSMFNGLTLVILGVIGLFTFPKVYETHQEKIDQNVDLVKSKINEIVDKVQAVLPIGKKAKSQ